MDCHDPRNPRPLSPDWNEDKASNFKYVADNVFYSYTND